MLHLLHIERRCNNENEPHPLNYDGALIKKKSSSCKAGTYFEDTSFTLEFRHVAIKLNMIY